jgi:rod shape-determining protein MreC
MKDVFKTKSFKVLIVTLIILITVTGFSEIFDTSILSTGVGYITVGMQRVSAAVTEDLNKKTYEELEAENKELKSEIATLRTQLADYENIKEENLRLWKYYDLKEENSNYDFVPSSVIRRDPSDSFYSFTIDRGSNDDIALNDPVVTENGLVGYISEVNGTYSKVTTILSPDLSAGAKDVKSRDTGVVTGDSYYSDKNLVTMKKIAENNKIKKGDQVSTTGIGGIYPENLPIGKVKEVKYDDFDTSLFAVIEPYEDVQNVSDVVVITAFEGQGEISTKTETQTTTGE